jgi:DNA-binding SARP family transcriptional activator
MTLRLSLLGAPLVERDGEPVAFDTRKALALLAYLGVTGRPHRREALAGLGWPDADRERALAALRRTLSTIRHVAGRWLSTTAWSPSMSLASARCSLRCADMIMP